MRNNLFLIIGEEKKVIDLNIHNILKNIEYDKNNKIEYDLTNSTVSDVIDEASMISMFSAIKIIVANNLVMDELTELEMDYLERYSKNYNKDVYIIFIAESVDARKKCYKVFKEYFSITNTKNIKSNDGVINYIKEVIGQKQFKINDSNIQYLISKTGNDINNISNELDKLFIYKEDDKTITREDIDLLVIDNIDNIIYEFTNAILDNDYDKISKMYDNFVLNNIDVVSLIPTIASSIKLSLIIKKYSNQGKSNEEIGNILDKHPFYILKTLERLAKYTEDDLCKYISKLAEIDRDKKMGNDNINKLRFFLFCKEELL